MSEQLGLFDSGLSTPPVEARGRMHRYPTDTEREAALKVAPLSGRQRIRVLEAIAAAGGDGATDWELAGALHMLHTSVNARRNELIRGGWVQDSGRRRYDPNTGARNIVWTLTRAGVAALEEKARAS